MMTPKEHLHFDPLKGHTIRTMGQVLPNGAVLDTFAVVDRAGRHLFCDSSWDACCDHLRAILEGTAQ